MSDNVGLAQGSQPGVWTKEPDYIHSMHPRPKNLS
jgi:hypothetical protein